LVGEVRPDALVELVGERVSGNTHRRGNPREFSTKHARPRGLARIGRACQAGEALSLCFAYASFNDVECLVELDLVHLGPPYQWVSGVVCGVALRLSRSAGVVVADLIS
jgi:hypothetical protein